MSITKTKRGPGRPKGSKNKVKTNVVKRGRGRPKGSKNKATIVAGGVKRGRGRPPGSKNKNLVQEDNYIDLPHTQPKNEEQRIANIAYMVSFYQNSEGKSKFLLNKPKKRGRKPKNFELDVEKLLKEDLDSDKLVYNDTDVKDELSRLDAYQDMNANSSRYFDDF